MGIVNNNFKEVEYKDTDIYSLYRMYLDEPEAMQHRLFDWWKNLIKRVDIMNYEEIKNKFIANKKIKFKLYSLEYIVEPKENYVEIYAIYYENRKKQYKSLDELMNSYRVYNEPLINQLNRIVVLNDDE